MRLGSDKCEALQHQSKTTLTSAYQQLEKFFVALELIQTKNRVVGGRLIYTFLFLNPNPFRVLDPYMQKG